MTRISLLPPDTTVTGDDYVASVDNAGPTTKKVTWANMVIWLKSQMFPVAAANINFGGSGTGIWWEEIGRTTLGVAGDNITVTVAARKYLTCMWYIKASGVVLPCVRFNSDSAANYAYTYDNSAASSTTSFGVANSVSSAAPLALLAGSMANGDATQGSIEIVNPATSAKLFKINGHLTGLTAANYSIVTQAWGHWSNTSAQITTIELVNTNTGDFAVGSELIVLGHD